MAWATHPGTERPALKLAPQGADLAIIDVGRDASGLPPAELRQAWQSIDSVADEVEALVRRCPPRYADLGNPMQYQRWSGR